MTAAHRSACPTPGASLHGGAPAQRSDEQWPAKFCDPAHLDEALSRLPRPWVFTNGVFDLLHRGHVQYLQEARTLGASLIVALNSDASARMLGKGPDRPLNRQVDRVWVLAALEAVSLLTLFDERTPLALLERIRPDVYVKGGDYDVAQLPEARLMARWGGRSLTLDYKHGYSTTGLVQKIASGRPD